MGTTLADHPALLSYSFAKRHGIEKLCLGETSAEEVLRAVFS